MFDGFRLDFSMIVDHVFIYFGSFWGSLFSSMNFDLLLCYLRLRRGGGYAALLRIGYYFHSTGEPFKALRGQYFSSTFKYFRGL